MGRQEGTATGGAIIDNDLFVMMMMMMMMEREDFAEQIAKLFF